MSYTLSCPKSTLFAKFPVMQVMLWPVAPMQVVVDKVLIHMTWALGNDVNQFHAAFVKQELVQAKPS